MDTRFPPHAESLLGCPQCDLLVRRHPVNRRYDSCCPRCGALLFKGCEDGITRALALSLSGLLLFVPAGGLPLLELNIMGQSGRCTMIRAVFQIYRNGDPWTAGLVLLCSLMAPLGILSLLCAVTLLLKLGRIRPLIVPLLRLYQGLSEWVMLDVYLIGILIAFIKMKDFGDLVPGTGLYCFIGVMAATTLAMTAFSTHKAWDMIGEGSP
ncbi:paraquat-inducible protein A [Desulfatiferula olefinivorans]